MRTDQGLFDALHAIAGQSVFVDTFVQFCGIYLPYVMGVGFFVLFFGSKDWRLRTYVLIEALLGIILARGLVTEAIYFFYPTIRPFASMGFEPLILVGEATSFPSGHAALLFALATAVFFVRRSWGIAYYALAGLVVIARVVAGVHWPLDIIAGAAIGASSALIVRGLLHHQHRHLTKQPTIPDNEPSKEGKVAETHSSNHEF